MAQSLLLPAAVLVVGLISVLGFTTPAHLRRTEQARSPAATVAGD
jgi:hypothetical protein